jgi:hypothetical protein
MQNQIKISKNSPLIPVNYMIHILTIIGSVDRQGQRKNHESNDKEFHGEMSTAD